MNKFKLPGDYDGKLTSVAWTKGKDGVRQRGIEGVVKRISSECPFRFLLPHPKVLGSEQ